MSQRVKIVSTLLVASIISGCGSNHKAKDAREAMVESQKGSMVLRSMKFIPKEGSPQLSWSGEPRGTKSFAIIIDDFDANDSVHWSVMNIDSSIHEVDAQNVPIGSLVTTPYQNPSFSDRHRYVAHLYALDIDDVTHVEGKDINNLLNKSYDHEQFVHDFRVHILANTILVSKPKTKGL